MLVIVAFVLFLYGAANLFWAAIPRAKTAQAIFALGIVLTLAAWLVVTSIIGVIVGALVTAIGFAMLILQRHH